MKCGKYKTPEEKLKLLAPTKSVLEQNDYHADIRW